MCSLTIKNDLLTCNNITENINVLFKHLLITYKYHPNQLESKLNIVRSYLTNAQNTKLNELIRNTYKNSTDNNIKNFVNTYLN